MILGGSSPRIVEQLINTTGIDSVLGQVVKLDSATDFGYTPSSGAESLAFGIVAKAGVPSGSYVPIVTAGVTDVLFSSTCSPARGDTATVSTTGAGRAATTPPEDTYAQSIGTVLESGSAPSALVKVNVFFAKTLNISGLRSDA